MANGCRGIRGEWRRDALALSIVLLLALGAWVIQECDRRRVLRRICKAACRNAPLRTSCASVRPIKPAEAATVLTSPRVAAVTARPIAWRRSWHLQVMILTSIASI
jgi:hypothetical protein